MTRVTSTEIEIRTRDGICRSFVFRPEGRGPWPAVLVYMDGIGIRPAMLELGERLATHGYFVLLPDLYYRSGPYDPMDARTVFTDPAARAVLTEKFMAHATADNVMSDTAAFLDWLAAEPDVLPGGIGVVGYCLGGRMAFIAAGTFPDRIVAAAAYHPSRLATDAPDSPHLLAPRIKARVYIGGASDDASFPEEMQRRLDEALTAAGVEHVVETYPAKHGWVFRDTAAYDTGAAERHWETMVGLFARALGPRK
ncbi:MAG TPA: dienelactone hydrolase family protein [Gemmatimonadales bacterium]|nr:dienelactone hydrolase family protein [Gemmatimonadales bacterium]